VAHGRAAHAGNALADGRSAIWALAKFVDRVQQHNGRIAGASASVGLIEGGTARNTVPDRASAELDLRFSDQAGKGAVEQLLAEAARTVMQELEGTRIEVRYGSARLPWPRNDGSAALAARYGTAARAAGLGADEAAVIGGGSDANTVGPLGLPTIDGLGPRGSGFHTRNEQVSLASLPLKAEALLRFLVAELSPGH
jgi:glutamate carboxypeptidase